MRRVSVVNLIKGMILGQPVYSSTGAMLIPARTTLTEQHISNLKNRGIIEVWVEDPRMEGVIIDEAVLNTTKIRALQAIRNLYQKASKNKDTKQVIIPDALINSVASELLDDISSGKNKVLNTFPPAPLDGYLPVHTVNVAMLSTTIGRQLKLNDMALFDLCVGALLYDIGMTFLPDELQNMEKENFTDEEFEELEKHVIYGFSALQQNKGISSTAQAVALQHHEKFDGTGYPKGLSGDQITLNAKIVAVADVYDSLLSDRPNRKRFQPHEAYEYVMTAGGFDFDLEIVQAFTMCVAPYPVGTMIKLNTGEKGVVSKVTWGLATRPTIRIFYDSDGTDVTSKIDIDLANKPSVLVNEVLDS